jgi:hypothetical protein
MSEVRQSRVVSKVRVLWMSIAARCVVPVGGMSDKPAFGFRGRGRNVRARHPFAALGRLTAPRRPADVSHEVSAFSMPHCGSSVRGPR